VDGGSSDATVEIASQYTSKIFFDKGPLGRARQTGAIKSTGEILGIFDSDIILTPSSWLREAVQQFDRNENIGVVWPVNKAPQNASIVSRCYFNFWNKRLERTQGALPGGNSLLLRKAFDEVNGFNVQLHFGEDMDLMYRIVRQGYNVTIFRCPIIHDSMHTLKAFTRKQIWGASSLLGLKAGQDKASLLSGCMTWKIRGGDNASSEPSYVLKEALLEHGLIGLQGMIEGLAKDRDYSWLCLPLLLGIRALIYGSFFTSAFFRKRIGLGA
jgi:glycosyltransferase involved in cell wall biosynthesis